MKLRVPLSKTRHMTVISAYAPTLTSPNASKELSGLPPRPTSLYHQYHVQDGTWLTSSSYASATSETYMWPAPGEVPNARRTTGWSGPSWVCTSRRIIETNQRLSEPRTTQAGWRILATRKSSNKHLRRSFRTAWPRIEMPLTSGMLLTL